MILTLGDLYERLRDIEVHSDTDLVIDVEGNPRSIRTLVVQQSNDQLIILMPTVPDPSHKVRH
jgi:hypothetical protein